MERVNIQTFRFSVDLKKAVMQELSFLRTIDSHPFLHDGPLLKQAIYRYENLWLPFAAKYRDHLLTAPTDIAWVWHCHMLAPLCYVKDCMNLCGSIIDHSLTPTLNEETTQSYWKQEYPSHPYNVDVSTEATYMDVSVFASKLIYKLEEAASRQKVFYYQVSLPHYRDEKFIRTAIVRYRKFLELKQCYPDNFIVPCYDVDVVWHAHQLHPVAYKRETEVLLGKHFNHDDSVNDRSPGSRLNVSDSETKDIWRKKYGKNFACSGAMFRGLPHTGMLSKIPFDVIFKGCTKDLVIDIVSAELQGASSTKKTLSLEFEARLTSGITLNVLKLKKVVGSRRFSEKHETEKRVGTCSSMTVLLYKNGILGSVGPKRLIGKSSLNVKQALEKCTQVGEPKHDVTIVHLGNHELKLEYAVTVDTLGEVRYLFDTGTYEECIMPEYIEDLWGPVPLNRLSEGQENKCHVANHRIKDLSGNVVFTVRVIHSLPCLMSVVQLFYQDKLSVVCHLLGPDTLPHPDQVLSDDLVTLDQAAGQRALIIKNNDGDWEILIATRFTLPTRRTPARLDVKMYKVSSGRWTTLTLIDWNITNDFVFSTGNCRVDLKNNMLECKVATGEVVENLALAFSVILLRVLYQGEWDIGRSFVPDNSRGGKVFRHLVIDDLRMYTAMGLPIFTPPNRFLRQSFLSHGTTPSVGGDTGTVNRPPNADEYDDTHRDYRVCGDDQIAALEKALSTKCTVLGPGHGTGEDPCRVGSYSRSSHYNGDGGDRSHSADDKMCTGVSHGGSGGDVFHGGGGGDVSHGGGGDVSHGGGGDVFHGGGGGHVSHGGAGCDVFYGGGGAGGCRGGGGGCGGCRGGGGRCGGCHGGGGCGGGGGGGGGGCGDWD